MIKTHVAIVLFAVLVFLPSVEYKFLFVLLALITTFIPDIDSAYSTLGRKPLSGFFQLFVKHRGFIHSFTFLFLIILFFLLVWPVGALGFFLGYSLHLFADSFTVEGIKPFYPFSKKITGRLKTGSLVETSIFVGFVIASFFMLIIRFSG